MNIYKFMNDVNDVIDELEKKSYYKEASILHDVFLKISQVGGNGSGSWAGTPVYTDEEIEGYLKIYKNKLLDDMRETGGNRDRAEAYYRAIKNLPIENSLKNKFIKEAYEIRKSLFETQKQRDLLSNQPVHQYYTEKIRLYKELYKSNDKIGADALLNSVINHFNLINQSSRAKAFQDQAADIRRRVKEFYK